jgi:carbonic anhydrase
MGDSFDRIVAGVKQFQRDVFPTKAELFQRLGNGQQPKVLFLTCSDSRINPNLITQSDPGELFICRNIGNVVPPHGTADGSVATVMEYAIDVLKIEEIVICGHSGCGAMKSLMDPTDDHIVPRVTEWLRFAASAQRLATTTRPGAVDWNAPENLEAVTKLNVIAQLANLRTYPAVAAHLHTGTLRIHGWYYDIRNGTVQTHDGAPNGEFVPLV